jgi:hypothetical protein
LTMILRQVTMRKLKFKRILRFIRFDCIRHLNYTLTV